MHNPCQRSAGQPPSQLEDLDRLFAALHLDRAVFHLLNLHVA
jgi:hypothetical protein